MPSLRIFYMALKRRDWVNWPVQWLSCVFGGWCTVEGPTSHDSVKQLVVAVCSIDVMVRL